MVVILFQSGPPARVQIRTLSPAGSAFRLPEALFGFDRGLVLQRHMCWAGAKAARQGLAARLTAIPRPVAFPQVKSSA
jgi:hypothetical protein